MNRDLFWFLNVHMKTRDTSLSTKCVRETTTRIKHSAHHHHPHQHQHSSQRITHQHHLHHLQENNHPQHQHHHQLLLQLTGLSPGNYMKKLQVDSVPPPHSLLCSEQTGGDAESRGGGEALWSSFKHQRVLREQEDLNSI